MALTVRYPSGATVTYNEATFLHRTELGWLLYTKEGGRWIASVQLASGAVIEAVRPCSTTGPGETAAGRATPRTCIRRPLLPTERSVVLRLRAAATAQNREAQ